MTKLRHTLALAAWFTGLWTVAACADGSDELDGRDFELASAVGFDAVRSNPVVLAFRDGELILNAGCNAQLGRYELRAGHVVVSELGSTTKDCAADLQAQDEWLASFIGKQPRLAISGVRLTLDAKSAMLVFVERVAMSTEAGLGSGAAP